MLTLAKKSSLNDINAATLAAIEKIKSGTLPNAKVNAANKAAIIFVSGMPIEDKTSGLAAQDSSLQDLIKNMETYQADQVNLITKLEKANIKALAFLPTESWNQIRKDSGLYTFHNRNGDGTVNTSLFIETFVANVTKKTSKGFEDKDLNWSAAHFCFALFTQISVVYFFSWEKFSAFLIPICICVLGTILQSIVTYSLHEILYKSIHLGLKRGIKSAGGMLNMLWPDKNEPDKINNSGFKVKVKVKFPEAPEDVKQTLLAAYKAGIKTTLTADASAICIETDVFALLKSKVKAEQKAREDFERELAARIKANPIIWVQEGKCVAVVAQYGDFPIEKQVIDKVLKENFLI